jgi:hypothetical protein
VSEGQTPVAGFRQLFGIAARACGHARQEVSLQAAQEEYAGTLIVLSPFKLGVDP